jgi:anti-sigma regulatory factor (Ser/Thr protein kinase)
MPLDAPSVAAFVPETPTDDAQNHNAQNHEGQDIVTAVRGDSSAGWCEVLPAAAGRSALVAAQVLTEPDAAARLSGQLRMAVRSLVRVDLAPGEALAQLDAVIRDWVEPFSARLLLGFFDPADGVVTLAYAGHPAPVVLGPDGITPVTDQAPDAPLGSPDAAPALGASYAETTVTLEPGTSLICWSPSELTASASWVDWSGALPAEGGSPVALADAVSRTLGAEAGAVLVVARPAQTDVGPVRVIELDLSEGEDPTRRARAFCYGVLSAWGLTPIVRDDIVLAVSELVANALLYGGAAEQLKLRRWPGRIVVEVYDREHTMPRPRIADADAESGRGLFLVRRVAQRWGARPVPGGKAVWCEFTVPTGDEAEDAGASSATALGTRADPGAGEREERRRVRRVEAAC